MKKIKREVLYVILVGIVFGGLSLSAWLKPADSFSKTERRELSQFPEFTIETIESGLFMNKFESYTLDQFPFRETFRSMKALANKYVFGQKDNNGVYMVGDYIGKLDYPYSEYAMNRAINKFNKIYEEHIAGSDAKVYFAMIPDKNYFLAEENGYLSIDYDKMYEVFQHGLRDNMTYIELRNMLQLEDYYYTDTHWKQENLLDVASYIADAMGIVLQSEYEKVTLDTPFYGVYYGQLALPVKPDQITYLNHPMFEKCIITNHETGKQIPMYDLNRVTGRDPYEMFLSGSLSVITIENPNATTEKELVIFRDSFGSSITPLFVEGYAKITMLDIRYLNETYIDKFVTFTDQDVLFLHSTGVINNNTAFK